MKKKIFKSLLIIVLLSGIVFFLSGCTNNNNESSSKKQKNIDGSSMTSEELLEMFESEGFSIRMDQFISSRYSNKSTYIILENEKTGITIQRIVNTLAGTLMSYRNENMSTEYADLIDLSRNKTNEEEELYDNFLDLLEKYNITQPQISNMMDYYYRNNPDKIEIIDTDKLLSE